MEQEQEKKTFKVFIDDNSHYMDETYRDFYGEYDSCEEAITVCKALVDESLRVNFKEGMTAEELFKQYTTFGEDPFVPSNGECPFSAWNYARERCEEICGRGNSGPKMTFG